MSGIGAAPFFEPPDDDPLLQRARALREAFHPDAPARDQAGGRPLRQVQWLRDSGLPSAAIPRAYGGEGAAWACVLRAVRELARTDGSLAHLYGYHHLPLYAVLSRGTPTQRDRWLGGSAQAHWLWGNAGNQMSRTSTARRDGGVWRLNGHRPFSSGSHVADRLLLAWEDEAGRRVHAVVPADREGLVVEDDWDGIGQRQTGSGTVRFVDVAVRDDELLGQPGEPLTPFGSLTPLLQQLVLLNVFLGSAEGALAEGRAYTTSESRPWIHSGVQRHGDDPWVQRKYGELGIRTLAAAELAEAAAQRFDAAFAKGPALTADERGRAAIAVASANLYAQETGLAVTSEVFEVMGARSATVARGHDRFWRNVRTHSLHNPAEYKKRSVGRWWLTGDYPEPAPYR